MAKTSRIKYQLFIAFLGIAILGGIFLFLPSEEKTIVPAQDIKPQTATVADAEPKAPVVSAETKSPITPMYRIDKSFDVVPIDPAGNKKIVLLTIDDAPASSKTIDPILKAMADENVHAIFFVMGDLIQWHPLLLKEIADNGHTIGNHTWDHANLKKITDEQAKKEIDSTTAIIQKTLGITPQFFRPPYGAYTDYVKAYTAENKMVLMNWSLGGEDWVKKYETKDALIMHVLEQLHPGANILMHEHPWTAEAMPEIIKGIKDAGYTIVEPSEIETL